MQKDGSYILKGNTKLLSVNNIQLPVVWFSAHITQDHINKIRGGIGDIIEQYWSDCSQEDRIQYAEMYCTSPSFTITRSSYGDTGIRTDIADLIKDYALSRDIDPDKVVCRCLGTYAYPMETMQTILIASVDDEDMNFFPIISGEGKFGITVSQTGNQYTVTWPVTSTKNGLKKLWIEAERGRYMPGSGFRWDHLAFACLLPDNATLKLHRCTQFTVTHSPKSCHKREVYHS
jgi:hypothetical protein